jgi:adenylate cyclase class IV
MSAGRAGQNDRWVGAPMPTNIEIKAAVTDWPRVRRRARELSGGDPQLIEQEDTFFRVPAGRLKLRKFSPTHGELIYYQRVHEGELAQSTYQIVAAPDPDGLTALLSKVFPIRGVVRKRRYLYLVGQTRIHLDEVADLGRFVELEVVLRAGQPAEEGKAIATGLMSELGIQSVHLIERAYIDLLEQGNTARQTCP